MYLPSLPSHPPIHRHTGGLEMLTSKTRRRSKIHRHTGGLETYITLRRDIKPIHRHTGGLEIIYHHWRIRY